MKTVRFPYGRTSMELHIDEKNLKAVLYNKGISQTAEKPEAQYVLDALKNPVGTKPLHEIAKGKKKVLLVTSDHTRAVPSRITLPILLAEIRKGNPDADITILIATGLHRATTEAEQRRMFGDSIVDHERIVCHNAFDSSAMRYVCSLPSGAEFYVNHLAMEADLLVTEGFIEPHFFAGFSGGRKSILPGIASAETVNENHSFRAIASPYARAGVLKENPISADMVYAARKVNVQFILNVALDENKKIIAAFAGDLEQAHERGCAFVNELARVNAVTGDIVITSNGGYPLDQNLYQAPKAASTAEACAGENGVIILIASCMDGLGGENFARLMQMGTASEIQRYLSSIPPKESISEQWCVQIFSQMLMKHTIILVTKGIDPETIRKINMIPAGSVDEALEIAYGIKGKNASVVAIPDGVAVMAV